MVAALVPDLHCGSSHARLLFLPGLCRWILDEFSTLSGAVDCPYWDHCRSKPMGLHPIKEGMASTGVTLAPMA